MANNSDPQWFRDLQERFAPTIKDALRRIRFSQVITDPFPEHTQYQMMERLFKIFGIPKAWSGNIPEPISIWAAYRMGYEKAYQEIEQACGVAHAAPNQADRER